MARRVPPTRARPIIRTGREGLANQFNKRGVSNDADRHRIGIITSTTGEPRRLRRRGSQGVLPPKGGTLVSRRRQPQRPTNPHDPKSKDPFARAGLAMGKNTTKIFKRAGMDMRLSKNMRL